MNEDMLVRILTEPKNALIPQYQMLLGMDKVKAKTVKKRKMVTRANFKLFAG